MQKKKPKTIMPWPVFKYASPTKASNMLTADKIERARTEFFEGSVKENGAYSLGSIETLESIKTIDDIIDVQPASLESIEPEPLPLDEMINVNTDNIEAIEAVDGIVKIEPFSCTRSIEHIALYPDTVYPDTVGIHAPIGIHEPKPINSIVNISDNQLRRGD